MKTTNLRVRCFMLDTGYCLAWENHVIQGGQHQRIACHSLVALLYHPEHGWLLWDTGYAPRMLEATQHLPFSLYRHATPLHIPPELAVVEQLKNWHITSKDINYVLLSHFHADHIAGLRDFPTARFFATQRAYADVTRRQGLSALRRAFIPALLPDDFNERVTLIRTFDSSPLSVLGPTYDLFGDKSLLLFLLPGHARGQMGLLANTEQGPILFAADACWLTRSIRENRPPSPLTHFFIDDAHALRSTLQALHDFSLAHPDVLIVPSHCPEALAHGLQERTSQPS